MGRNSKKSGSEEEKGREGLGGGGTAVLNSEDMWRRGRIWMVENNVDE
jgi:hypothetical protein